MTEGPSPPAGEPADGDPSRAAILAGALTSPAVRRLKAFLAVALTCGSLAWSADLFRAVGLNLLDEQIMGPMLGIGLMLVYITFPARRGPARTSVPWYDWIAGLAGLAAGWYIGFTFPTLVERMIERPPDALIVSAVLYLLCLEGLRRATGWALLSVVLLFSAYSLVGHLVPGDLQTRQVDLARLLIYSSIDTSALLGLVLNVALSIVVTFVFFGQILMKAGGGQFFNDLALALMGRYRGGSAKISITASSLFGSVSGIVVSNIVATGIVTIPLMKKNGFPPRLAAAVEACASTGGQLMPPVMGATAFIMADFLSRPYQDIVVAALVPSLLYYVALFIQADLEAASRGIKRVEEGLIPPLLRVLANGWPFILPFAVLVYTLFALNWLVERSAIAAALTIMVFGMCVGFGDDKVAARLTKFAAYAALLWILFEAFARLGWGVEIGMIAASLVTMAVGRLARTATNPLTPRMIYEALRDTGTSILDLLMIAAGASFIIGILLVTGLGFALTLLLLKVGGGTLFGVLLVAGSLCIVLGMGMPTVAVYVILAALVAPSMVELGVTPLAAHMFVMYLGMMSFLTPPVAIAAYFAASMAQAPAMATAWTSMRFGWTAYVVPFLFVFAPSLLLEDADPWHVTIDVATAVGGVWLISMAMVGYALRPLSAALRVLVFAAGVMLLVPFKIAPGGHWTNAAGAVLALALLAREYNARHRERMAAQPTPLA
ncbi:MAG TPA: TRAP transporter fused permease subunit [Burkholderiales bacterium]|nr:TRAP transporter fused permease subunit [Burkholderiales bacterium]